MKIKEKKEIKEGKKEKIKKVVECLHTRQTQKHTIRVKRPCGRHVMQIVHLGR